MCWSCNAICGGCRPPRKRPVKCPECGTHNVYDIEQDMGTKECKKCGADLTEYAVPEARTCNFSGEMCYNPCKKSIQETPAGGYQECRNRVTEPITYDKKAAG